MLKNYGYLYDVIGEKVIIAVFDKDMNETYLELTCPDAFYRETLQSLLDSEDVIFVDYNPDTKTVLTPEEIGDDY